MTDHLQICPKCKEPVNEIADCNSATCPTMRAFNSWWLASKYMQVVHSDKNTRQIALDGWNAARTTHDDTTLLKQCLDALTCSDTADDPGHRCGHCDDYVDRNGTLRTALRERLI